MLAVAEDFNLTDFADAIRQSILLTILLKHPSQRNECCRNR